MWNSTMMVLLVITFAVGASQAEVAQSPPMPRSNGCVLHADFENYVDGVVGALDAGIRQLGDPFTDIKQGVIKVANDPRVAFEGNRCAVVATDALDQRGHLILQRRFDAAELTDEVVELVFRPVAEGATDLKDFVVWSALGYRSGRVGLALVANGLAAHGTYALDVEAGGAAPTRSPHVIEGWKQTDWIHIVLARSRANKTVDLWAGAPERAQWIGCYADLDPARAIGRAQIGDVATDAALGSGCWDNIRVGQALRPGEALAPPEVMRDVATERPALEDPLVVGAARQLFVDDAVIESTDRLDRTFHSATKHPQNPLVRPERTWETGGTWFVPFDVLRDRPDGGLRLWYGCYRKSANKLTFSCVADSTDGVHWTRPALGLFDFEGSKANNIIWQGRGVKPNFDPRDPDPSQRYKAMTRVDGFTPMFSPDGLRWTIASAPAIEQAYDASTFHWDPVGQKWLASCKMFRDGQRARGYAESLDYVNWSDTYLMLRADDRDHPQDELYAMRIVRYESVYVGLLKVYHVSTDQCDIQLAFSRNAKCWERPFRTPFLANSPQHGACDYGNLDEAGAPIRSGDQLWFYYGGRSNLHNQPPEETNGSLCLATLRLDGFVSLDAGPEEGVLLTKPLLLKGASLFLNADAQNGAIRVEIADAGDTGDPTRAAPIAPCTKANCVPVTTDRVQHAVTWANTPTLQTLRAKPVRLRFFLRNAKIYSFWTG
ncbi:MAG: hypothetical protein A2W31_07195 [Planctomycetes bacterium RBG_16_64_10]|nr:MAG: hypothetical protein A2W31_07195 [Planctomycetes bacterium RBG_16_64_10]